MCVRGNGDGSCKGEDWFVTRRLDGVAILMLWQLIMWQEVCDATNRQRSFGLDRGSSCSGGTACTDHSEPSWFASRHPSPVSIPEKIKDTLVKVFEVQAKPRRRLFGAWKKCLTFHCFHTEVIYKDSWVILLDVFNMMIEESTYIWFWALYSESSRLAFLTDFQGEPKPEAW